MAYSEVNEEKGIWDERARTIINDIELRGPLKNPVKQLNKSRAYICKLFKKIGKNNLILDIGCGNGLFTSPLANIFNFVVGIDISKAMIKRHREKRGNLDFIVASATNLPLRGHVFDSVISLSVLEYIRPKNNLEKALKEILRVATKDSFVFLTFWNTPISSTNFVKSILKREKCYVKQSLVSMLQFTGLQFTKYVKLYVRTR